MKRDAVLGIALILTGSLGLVSQNNFFKAVDPASPKQGSTLQMESTATSAVYNYQVEATTLTAAVCESKLGIVSGKTTLLDKLSVALTDLDTVVSLQRL